MMKKFKDLITANGVFSDGDWVESKDQDPNGDVRLIQLADIGVGTFINKSNRFMTSDKAGELKCTYLEQGDILIARMPDPIGRACIFPELNTKCVTVVDICIVRPASEEIDSRWLMHLINSERFNNQILKFVTGTTRQRISRGNLAKLDVEVPPLDEQKRIAAILDKADAIRRKRQQAIDLADDFLRSVFLDMFGDPVTNPKGWDVKSMKDLIKMQGGYAFKSGDFGAVGIPVVKIGNANKLGFTTKDIAFIEPEFPEKLKQYELYAGDLLMSLTGTVGKDDYANITEVSDEYPMYYLNQRVAKITVDENIASKNYLKFYLAHPKIKGEITRAC